MIVIREALTAADRLAVIAVSQAATRPAAPPEPYAALRLASARRALATWWLLEEDGRAVSSLVCHPLSLAGSGGVRPGYGLGAVATRPEAQRKGHAERLCRHVIATSEAEGRSVGLLYSAIPPAYYERMGFRCVEAWHHVCARPYDLSTSGPQATLLPLDPRRESARLAQLYEQHAGSALHLQRDAAGFGRSVSLNPADLFFGVGEPLRGYVRVCWEPGWLEVSELVVADADVAPVLRALAHLAYRHSCARLEGWFPPVPPLASHFTDRGRASTLPMVRGADAAPRPPFWSSDYF